MVKQTNSFCKPVLILVLVVLLGGLGGCAATRTSKTQYTGINTMLANRQYDAALRQILAAKDNGYTPKEKVVFYLDAGMLYHYNKQYAKSNEMLSKAEDAIEELFTKSISRAAASFVLNDNVMEYSGEDYEDIYLNVFKALNYLELNQFDEAFVEIRRINLKLEKLEGKYADLAKGYSNSDKCKVDIKPAKNKFHNSALGRYLSMLLYRAEGNFDDARIDMDKIEEAFMLQANLYKFNMPDLRENLEKTDKARINIVAFNGTAPDKKAGSFFIHTEKDLLVFATATEDERGKQMLEDMDAIGWKGIEEGYHFKFQLPYMEKRGSRVGSIRVLIDNNPVGSLYMLEDLEEIALQTYKVKEPLIYIKTVARAVAKGLAAEKAKAKLTEKTGDNLLGFAARLATDFAVDATENADLRISRFFPAKARIAEFSVPPGEHSVKLQYFDKNDNLLFVEDKGIINAKSNKLNLIESFYLN